MGFFSKIGHKISGAAHKIGSKFTKKNLHKLGSKVSHVYKAVRHGLNVADPYLSKLATIGGAIYGGGMAVLAGPETGGASWAAIGAGARSGAAAGALAYQTAKQGLIALDQGQKAIGRAKKAYSAGDHDAAFKHGIAAATAAENAASAATATKKNYGTVADGMAAANARRGGIRQIAGSDGHLVLDYS